MKRNINKKILTKLIDVFYTLAFYNDIKPNFFKIIEDSDLILQFLAENNELFAISARKTLIDYSILLIYFPNTTIKT